MKGLLLTLSLCLLADVAYGGLLLVASFGAGTFTFRPENDEKTPTYLGYTPSLTAGYSLLQSVDLALFASYTPAGFKKFVTFHEHGALVFYGAQISGRIEDIVLGARAGRGKYSLYRVSEPEQELPGHYMGPGFGIFLGTNIKITRRHFFQVTVDFNQFVLRPLSEPLDGGTGIRKMDQVMLTLSYAFNEFVNYLIEDSLFDSVF